MIICYRQRTPTVAELGFKLLLEDVDVADWLVAARFDLHVPRDVIECETMLEQIRATYGKDRAHRFTSPPLPVVEHAYIIIHPDDESVHDLVQNQLAQMEGGDSLDPLRYRENMDAHVHEHWSNMTPFRRLDLIVPRGCDVGWVLEAECPTELWRAVAEELNGNECQLSM